MATLPTNFKDDILDTSVNTRRRYRVYENTDGTIELEDVTEYSQVGDEFGAGQINATNTEVNKKFDKNMLVRDLDTINAITKEGYAPDALALKEVNDSLETLGGFTPVIDETTGKITGYKTEIGGADTVFPFSGADGMYIIGSKYLKDRSFTTDPLSFNRNPAMCSANSFQCMTEPIDLTAYNTIKFGAQGYATSAKQIGVGITKTLPASVSDCKAIKYVEKSVIASQNTFVEMELDISDIQGEYYIPVYNNGAQFSTLYLYLE